MHLARHTSLLAALLTASVMAWQVPPGPDARLWIGGGTLASFFLVRMIVLRAARELLPD